MVVVDISLIERDGGNLGAYELVEIVGDWNPVFLLRFLFPRVLFPTIGYWDIRFHQYLRNQRRQYVIELETFRKHSYYKSWWRLWETGTRSFCSTSFSASLVSYLTTNTLFAQEVRCTLKLIPVYQTSPSAYASAQRTRPDFLIYFSPFFFLPQIPTNLRILVLIQQIKDQGRNVCTDLIMEPVVVVLIVELGI